MSCPNNANHIQDVENFLNSMKSYNSIRIVLDKFHILKGIAMLHQSVYGNVKNQRLQTNSLAEPSQQENELSIIATNAMLELVQFCDQFEYVMETLVQSLRK